jgi:hypothetical protein
VGDTLINPELMGDGAFDPDAGIGSFRFHLDNLAG